MPASIINKIKAREILDSRGNPTVEAEVILQNHVVGRASVPSGASTGQHEAVELRDQDSSRFLGKGVTQAIHFIQTEVAEALIGTSVSEQSELDRRLCEVDGTPNKARIGANATLAVSLAAARASALLKNEPLYAALRMAQKQYMPLPLMNILNGGAHADNNVDIQEFMIAPVGATSFAHAIQMGVEVFHQLKSLLKSKGLNTAVGDEGGFAPSLTSNQQALDLLSEAVNRAQYRLGQDIVFALDVAASELYQEKSYHLKSENRVLTSEEMIQYYQSLCQLYPILSIEDGLDESDWTGWQKLTEALGKKIQLVGDDIFVTNTQLLKRGIDQHVANAILIKPNQIGTLTETCQAIQLAQAHHYETIMSHRSGETEDTFIADLAVAMGCKQIKTGSLCRSDRVAKYNQLLRIEEQSHFPYAQHVLPSLVE